MKWLQTLLLLAGVCCGSAFAQMKDPTTWTYEVRKTARDRYELVLHARLDGKWHLYAMEPGGDGTLIPPTFTFKTPANVKLVGKVKESGKMVTQTMEGIDGAVHYYMGSVDYVQEVKASGGARITGELEYQVCSESVCLPPKKKDFTFDLKP